MQCSSCGFENMPGSDACGRCGSSLRLATMVMDVQPPRAGKITKKLRRVLPVSKAKYAMRDRCAAAVERAPDQAYAWYQQGRCQMLTGLSKPARLSFRQCLDLEPKHHGARAALKEMEQD